MAKVLCVLYDDPVGGYPTSYARDAIPKIEHYPGGQTVPNPKQIDFKPGELLGSVSGELGLRRFLEAQGHTLIVTADKDGPNSIFERELVAEHVVMMILALVRNYIPSYQWVVNGGWNIADCVSRAYDLEAMAVGTVGAGRIGGAVLRRLKPFDVELHYTDRHRLPATVEQELKVTFHPTAEQLVRVCDVVTINTPLHPETEHLFNDELIAQMKRGAYLVNTARGKICDRDAVARALESGRLAGYAGDVWFPQPAPKDHPWRNMPHHGMTPHVSGTSLSAQARYAAGVREILECWFASRPIRDEYLIVAGGRLAGAGAHSYSAGNVTGGSEEAARFNK